MQLVAVVVVVVELMSVADFGYRSVQTKIFLATDTEFGKIVKKFCLASSAKFLAKLGACLGCDSKNPENLKWSLFVTCCVR